MLRANKILILGEVGLQCVQITAALFETTRTIYSNSERSEECLVTECFLTCFWRFLISNELEQLNLKLEKNIGIKKHAGKIIKINFR